jgi:hypothetical protein
MKANDNVIVTDLSSDRHLHRGVIISIAPKNDMASVKFLTGEVVWFYLSQLTAYTS